MINNSKLTIIIAVFTISFIGYHVLTAVEASKEAASVSKDDIRKMKFVNDDEDEYGLKDIAIDQTCKDTGGQLKDYNTWCYFDKKGKAAGNEAEFEHQLEDRGLSNLYYDKESGSDEWEKYQQEKYEESQKGVKEYEKFLAEQEEIAAEATKDPVTVCMNHDGEWTHDVTCKFKDGVEMDKPYSKEQYQADFEHYMEEEGVWDEYAEQQNKDREERAEMTQSKTFEKFVKSKGIDYDDDYDWLSVDEQLAIESEFREYDPDEYAEEINNKKDKKEPVPVIEDWQNEVTTTDEQIKETAQEISEGEEWNNYPITQTPTNEEESSEEEQEK